MDQFNILVGLDCFEMKDADGRTWLMLSILCQGTDCHVVVLLEDSHKNPSSAEVRKTYELCWLSWAGQPEEAVMVDRSRSFLKDFAEYLEEEGMRMDSAALASPWHIGKTERHGGVWKASMQRVTHDKQVAGLEDMRSAVVETNRSKNMLARKSGFSP